MNVPDLKIGDLVEVELDDSCGRTRTAKVENIRRIEWMPGRFAFKIDVDIDGDQFEVSPDRAISFSEEDRS